MSFERFLSFTKIVFKIRNIQFTHRAINPMLINEDHYWGHVLAAFFSDFNVAPVNDAIRFSFEVNPTLLYKMNNGQLPFGCHAWERYDPEFWLPFINTHFENELEK